MGSEKDIFIVSRNVQQYQFLSHLAYKQCQRLLICRIIIMNDYLAIVKEKLDPDIYAYTLPKHKYVLEFYQLIPVTLHIII